MSKKGHKRISKIKGFFMYLAFPVLPFVCAVILVGIFMTALFLAPYLVLSLFMVEIESIALINILWAIGLTGFIIMRQIRFNYTSPKEKQRINTHLDIA